MREAGADDVAFIAGLFRLPHAKRYLNVPSRAIVLAGIDDPNNEEYVIERDGEAAGYLRLKNYDWLIELDLLIAREQGRGLGRFALEWAMQHAFAESRAHRVFAQVRESNVKTQALLESLGMRREGLYRHGFYDARTGGYENLIPYGILDGEYRTRAVP